MEPGSKHNVVIARYLLNEADNEEKRLILDWMNADEKNRLYVENLRKTLQFIDLVQEQDKVNVDKEWRRILEHITGDQETLSELNPPAIPENAIVKEKPYSTGRIYSIFTSSAAAAAAVLFICFGWWLFHRTRDTPKATARAQIVSKEEIDSVMAVVYHEVNTSGKTIRFGLPDGSQIALSNNSEITYKEPVNGHTRDVYLKGKADFNVAKDKSKPFTVYSGDISTTAIGTRFTVTAADSGSYILVKLSEGRIVVRPVNGHSRWLEDFYLIPGQELIYDNSRKTAKVRSGTPAQRKSSIDKIATKDDPSVPHYNNRSWFMFNNQSLPEVFDALADMYHVKIVYAKEEMKDKYFIGTFDRSEPFEKILSQIAMLNNLSITNEKDTFFIKTQPLNQRR